MGRILLVAIAGFVASFVDGVLGMGFGPTSSTLLLGAGLAPAAVSTTVNIAKVATGTAGGVAHWRFGNIDRRLVLRLALPGCVGALVGVTVLANVDGDRIRPYLAALLSIVGARILLRFSRPAVAASSPTADIDADAGAPAALDYSPRGIGAAALAGGVTNGLIGAWGPVVTPVLLSREGLPPRVAIGSVNTAEIAVAAVASGSLLASLGSGDVKWSTLVAMLVGGAVAAPFAAWSVRRVSPRALGIGAGGMLLFTNLRDLSGWADLGTVRWIAYVAVAVAIAAAVRRSAGPTIPAAAPADPARFRPTTPATDAAS
jgi:uncharacterized protein